MTTRERMTTAMRQVHDEAIRRPWPHWIIGMAFLGYAVYRVESHTHADGDRVEHIITAAAFLFGAAVTPYVKESVIGFVRGLAPYIPFVGKRNGNGDPNSTLSGGASRPREKP